MELQSLIVYDQRLFLTSFISLQDQLAVQTRFLKTHWIGSSVLFQSLNASLFALQLNLTLLREWQVTEWNKIFANHTSNKWLVSRLYKEHSKFNSKETNTFRKCAKGMMDISWKRIDRWQRSTWKDVQHWPLGKCRLNPQCNITTNLSGWLK